MRTIRFLFFGLIVVLTGNCYAQCEVLLKEGLFEYSMTSKAEDRAASFVNYMRDQLNTTSSTNTRGEASIGIKIIKADLKGDQQKFDTLSRDVVNYKKTDEEQRTRLLDIATRVNTELAREFTKCQQAEGFHVWVEHTADPAVFKVAAVTRDSSDKPTATTIKSITVSPADVVCEPSMTKQVGAAGARTICTRKTCAPVTAVINASRNPTGGGSLNIGSFCSAADADGGTVGNNKLCPTGSLEGRNIGVHYSPQNIVLSDVQVGGILRAAGATVYPNEKPRSETSNPKYVDYRIYFKDVASADRLASRLKTCLSKVGPYQKVEAYPFTAGILGGPFAQYDAVIYAVEQ